VRPFASIHDTTRLSGARQTPLKSRLYRRRTQQAIFGLSNEVDEGYLHYPQSRSDRRGTAQKFHRAGGGIDDLTRFSTSRHKVGASSDRRGMLQVILLGKRDVSFNGTLVWRAVGVVPHVNILRNGLSRTRYCSRSQLVPLRYSADRRAPVAGAKRSITRLHMQVRRSPPDDQLS